MSPSIVALAGFAGWFVLLTLGLAFTRTAATLGQGKAPNSFAVDGSDLGGFAQRLNRARDNCYENLPAFAALILAASLAGRLEVTDGTAMIVLYARIAQSVTHMASTSVPAVFARFGFYGVQIFVMLYWVIQLLG